MATVTPLDARRRPPSPSSVYSFKTALSAGEDPLSIVDPVTRRLLERGPAARRGHLVPRLLVAADMIGLLVAYALATLGWGQNGAFGSPREVGLFAASLPCWVLLARLHGLYHRDEERTDHCTTDDIVGVVHLVTAGVWLLLVVSRLTGQTGPSILNLTALWGLAVCVVPICRTAARRMARRSGSYVQNTVIVGAGEIGQLICRKLLKHPEYGANVVGFVDRNPRIRRPDLPEHISVLGTPERLPEIIERLAVERVVIAFSGEPAPALVSLLRRLRPLDVQIDLVPWLFELVGPRVSVHTVEGLPLIGLPRQRLGTAALALKRAIDIVGAGLALVLLSPLMAYIAMLIRRDSSGPVLFHQVRVGERMREFEALKFRTMKVGTDTGEHRDYIRRTMATGAAAEGNGLYKLDRSDAVTAVGRWLRRTSLDELPQLINVLRGEMSLVGPRPCIPYEIECFKAHHLERFAMPQGLTGLWQVTARANATFLEALDLDVAYVRDWSLGLDLRLLLRTPLQLLRQRTGTA